MKPGTTLAEKIAFLSNPRSYPDSPRSVDAIETHMSWVFLTGTQVYKMKKPVRLPFLDFTTLEARRLNCHAEVTLNRRLATDVYFGVEPLVVDDDGSIRLGAGAGGTPIEWLVHMRRLPAERMLDRLILEHRVIEADVDEAAYRLARFYREAAPVEYRAEEYRRRLARDIEANHEALSDPAFEQAVDRVDRVHDVQQTFLESAAGLFDRRVNEGRIIEAHGDLRPEHICLVDPPVIIDCLEFNREFRLLDPVDELAFLYLECDMAGADFVGERFLSVYRRVVGDHPPPALRAFYACGRACLRAKLAVWHLEDDPDQIRDNWIRKAAGYLARAEKYAAGIHGHG